MGNHDVAASGEPLMDGMDQVVVTLLIPGRPHLFLTHQPLESGPAGTVNVHGHIHNKPSPTTERHLNVSVEQLHYRPVRLEELEGLAGHPTNAKLIGSSDAELAFYDALGVNNSAVQVLGDETLRAIARELVETVRGNVTIDWTLRENIRAN